MNRAEKLRSILGHVVKVQAERHVLGEEVHLAHAAEEKVFQTDEELALIAEINARIGLELSVYARILTALVTPDNVTNHMAQILYQAQQQAEKCHCDNCAAKLKKDRN